MASGDLVQLVKYSTMGTLVLLALSHGAYCHDTNPQRLIFHPEQA